MVASSEFPCLEPLGLYAQDIPGDGNCMFHALSDQLFGSIDRSSEVRAKVIEHVVLNKHYYINYIDVQPGGSTNRRPKRKNAAYAGRGDLTITKEDRERAFENYVKNMSKKGTYGDNLEMAAFAAHYGVYIRIFLPNDSYVISPQTVDPLNPVKVANIAYHADYEHYSSVRKVGGPFSGPTEIDLPVDNDSSSAPSSQGSSSHGPAPQWMVNLVVKSLAYPISDETAVMALYANGNNVDAAVTAILDSGNSTPDVQSVQSSSVERELGSDEDSQVRKRQNRRVNRARQERHREVLQDKLASMSADSLDSLVNSSADSSVRRSYVDSGDETMSSPPPLDDGSTSPDSTYSPPSEVSVPAAKPKITLRLSKPTEPAAQAYPTKLILKKSPKKSLSARDAKALKKQAQKQARKERRQHEASAAANYDAMNVDVVSDSFGNTSAGSFRTMHI